MGVDIYPMIEVDWAEDRAPFTDDTSVRGFNLGPLFIWRRPELFWALGLGTCPRCRIGKGPDDTPPAPLFPLRGLPENYGHGVLARYFQIVDVHPHESIYDPLMPVVTPARAKRWFDEGLSEEGPPLIAYHPPHGERKRLRRASCPTWHCTSWLTTAEFRQVVDSVPPSADLQADVRATLAAMQTFDDRLGPAHARLVYWFDNCPN
jgi:hypothetical protein